MDLACEGSASQLLSLRSSTFTGLESKGRTTGLSRTQQGLAEESFRIKGETPIGWEILIQNQENQTAMYSNMPHLDLWSCSYESMVQLVDPRKRITILCTFLRMFQTWIYGCVDFLFKRGQPVCLVYKVCGLHSFVDVLTNYRFVIARKESRTRNLILS